MGFALNAGGWTGDPLIVDDADAKRMSPSELGMKDSTVMRRTFSFQRETMDLYHHARTGENLA